MSSLFGGGPPQTTFSPAGFNVNPLTGFGVTGRGDPQQSPTLAANIGGLQSTFGAQAGATAALAGTVAPGFSQGRQAGLATLESQRQANLSNLSDNLAQRRILGSSFANSEISNANATFAEQEASFQATSYLQELQAYDTLMQQQYQASTQQYSTYINQSNIESGLAANLAQSNNQIAAQIAMANTQLQAQSQAGTGKLIGTIGGAAVGFALGGPAGAMMGASIGGAAFGGGGTGGGGYGGYGGLNSQPFGGFFNSTGGGSSGSAAVTPTFSPNTSSGAIY
jgi:hypothetical protein